MGVTRSNSVLFSTPGLLSHLWEKEKGGDKKEKGRRKKGIEKERMEGRRNKKREKDRKEEGIQGERKKGKKKKVFWWL